MDLPLSQEIIGTAGRGVVRRDEVGDGSVSKKSLHAAAVSAAAPLIRGLTRTFDARKRMTKELDGFSRIDFDFSSIMPAGTEAIKPRNTGRA